VRVARVVLLGVFWAAIVVGVVIAGQGGPAFIYQGF